MQLNCVKFVVMGIVRKTASVKFVLSIFEEREKAVSVVALVKLLKEKMNKTTVYRILDRLEQDGIIHSFLGKDGLRWYAKCQGCSADHHLDVHPHFQCKDCGDVECLPVDVVIPSVENKQVDSAEIMLVGKCSNCL